MGGGVEVAAAAGLDEVTGAAVVTPVVAGKFVASGAGAGCDVHAVNRQSVSAMALRRSFMSAIMAET